MRTSEESAALLSSLLFRFVAFFSGVSVSRNKPRSLQMLLNDRKKTGNPSLFKADFITPINLGEIKAHLTPAPLLSLCLLIRIRVRLTAHFDGGPDRIWAKLQMWNLEAPLTLDPCR